MTDRVVSAYDWYQSELAALRLLANKKDWSPEGDAAYEKQYRRVKAAYFVACRSS